MRTFHLMKGREISAPLSEAEVAAMVAAGELTAEQPCHLAGEDVWRTVGDFFPNGSGLKVRLTKAAPSAAEQDSAAHRIDDLTRRRLLAYGLADAVNLDGFTQSQAVTAIVRKEQELRREWRAHRTVQVGAFFAMLAAGFVLGATENPLSLRLERSAALLLRQDGDPKTSLSVLRSTLADRAYVRERDRQREAARRQADGK